MNFRFNIELNDRDYYELNKFKMIETKYGKRMNRALKLIAVIMAFVYSLTVLIDGKFSAAAFLGIIPYILFVVVFCLMLRLINIMCVKIVVKAAKKSVKTPYTPSAVMEFYEDKFVEESPEARIESAYSAIDEVYVYGEKYVYIFINSTMVYIIPMKSFESSGQLKRFTEFLKGKGITLTYVN